MQTDFAPISHRSFVSPADFPHQVAATKQQLASIESRCSDWLLGRLATFIVLAKSCHQDGQLKSAASLYRVALNLLVLSLSNDQVLLSDLTVSLSEVEFLLGDYDRAEKLLLWSMSIDAVRIGETHEHYIQKSCQLKGLQQAKAHRNRQ